jgi:hypothetical protein
MDVAKTINTYTELYHSFIQYTGSYIFRQWTAIIRELLGFVWVTWNADRIGGISYNVCLCGLCASSIQECKVVCVSTIGCCKYFEAILMPAITCHSWHTQLSMEKVGNYIKAFMNCKNNVTWFISGDKGWYRPYVTYRAEPDSISLLHFRAI